MSESLGWHPHTLKGQLRRSGNIIKWECHRLKSRVKLLCRCNGKATVVNPDRMERPRGDMRIIKDISYMKLHGLSIKEPRQTLRTLPNADSTWHDWKHAEYVNAATGHQTGQEAPNPEPPKDTSSTRITPLTRLPRELLDLILTFLPDVAQLSARLSCPEFYYCGGSQPRFSLIYTLNNDPDRESCTEQIEGAVLILVFLLVKGSFTVLGKRMLGITMSEEGSSIVTEASRGFHMSISEITLSWPTANYITAIRRVENQYHPLSYRIRYDFRFHFSGGRIVFPPSPQLTLKDFAETSFQVLSTCGFKRSENDVCGRATVARRAVRLSAANAKR
ncbi:MAG: hypothetical protein Q9170_004235, partial [Blastenia crenularia]